MLDGETVEVRQLADTVDGLCLARQQASTDPRAARATYQRRSRDGVEITARALQRSNSILASEVAQAKIGVEADLSSDPPGPTLDLRLGSLLETVREGLARFGIPTDACKT